MSDEAAVAATARTALAGVRTERGVAKPDAILVVDSMRKHFGGLLAVDIDHLEVQRGAITALIGPNGAGKTTLFNLLTGFESPDGGRWTFDGAPVSGMPAYRLAAQGMVRTFQLTRVMARLTVLDNMKLAAPNEAGEQLLTALIPPVWRHREREIETQADALLERFNLAHVRNDYAGELSGGQRKLLEMARALMTQPRLLMLDEPMAGVNPALQGAILEHVRELRDEGMTMVFIEHNMDVVMGIGDWVVCLAQGQVISEGPPHAVAADDAVIDAYLGTRRDSPRRGGA